MDKCLTCLFDAKEGSRGSRPAQPGVCMQMVSRADPWAWRGVTLIARKSWATANLCSCTQWECA